MTITVTQPVGQYGFGMVFRGTVSGFTISDGDYVESIVTSGLLRASYTAAQVTDLSTGEFGGSSNISTIGVDSHLGTIPTVEAGLVPGAAITLLLNWRQSSGVLVDSTTLGGYTWDPFTGIPGMVRVLYNFDSFLQQIMQFDILPSVRKSY